MFVSTVRHPSVWTVANFATAEIWSKESHIVFFIKGSFNQQYIVDNKKIQVYY